MQLIRWCLRSTKKKQEIEQNVKSLLKAKVNNIDVSFQREIKPLFYPICLNFVVVCETLYYSVCTLT